MNLILYARFIVDLQIYFVSPCIFLIYSNDSDGNVKKVLHIYKLFWFETIQADKRF